MKIVKKIILVLGGLSAVGWIFTLLSAYHILSEIAHSFMLIQGTVVLTGMTWLLYLGVGLSNVFYARKHEIHVEQTTKLATRIVSYAMYALIYCLLKKLSVQDFFAYFLMMCVLFLPSASLFPYYILKRN
ncbi:hypothetical protein KG091_03355 [Carnobacteriaceae bacterium zg-ZUI78]|nr:hypothetical protein [Carnobacteriaceae bacterium zg-ZUI78]